MRIIRYSKKLAILLTGFILLSSPLSAKRIYSAKYLEVNKNWVLEFREGPRLTFTGVGNDRISFTWENNGSSPWLFENSHMISGGTFTELRTKELQNMIDSVYNAKLTLWQQDKKAYESKEKDRYEQESGIYEKKKLVFNQRLEKNHQAALDKWTDAKNQFQIEAQKELAEKSKKWKNDRVEFEKTEDSRIADAIEKQKEHHQVLKNEWENKNATHEKETRDYMAKYDQYKEDLKKQKEDIGKCVQNGRSRNECIVNYPMPKRPKKPTEFTEPEPVFVQQPVPRNPFPKSEPIMAEFKAPEPVKSKEVFSDPKPRPPGEYSVPMPQPDTAPVFGVTGLILHLSKTNCEQGNYILKKQNSIASIATKAEQETGFSLWEGHGILKKCRVIGRGDNSQDTFFSILIDKGNHPVTVLFGSSTIFHLGRITNPTIESFQKELQKRVFQIRDIDEFTISNGQMDYDPINVRYFVEDEGKWAFLTYEVIGENKRKGVKKLTMDIPQYMVDASQRDKSFRVNRVSLMDDMRKGNDIYLQLKRNYWHAVNADQKDWQFKADYKFGMVQQDKLRNIIKVVAKDDQNNNTENEINSAGIVYDYTSLWYLLPWLQRTRTLELKLTYFDDKRVFGRVMKRIERKTIPFIDSYEESREEVEVDHWMLLDSQTNEQLARFLVGTRDRMIYQANIGGKQFELKTADTDRILQNRKWKQEQKQQHDIVEFQSP